MSLAKIFLVFCFILGACQAGGKNRIAYFWSLDISIICSKSIENVSPATLVSRFFNIHFFTN